MSGKKERKTRQYINRTYKRSVQEYAKKDAYARQKAWEKLAKKFLLFLILSLFVNIVLILVVVLMIV
jgi:hypothetical protein